MNAAKYIYLLQPQYMVALMLCAASAMAPAASAQEPDPPAAGKALASREREFLDNLFAYLNMAASRSDDLRPLTQAERNRLFGKSLINPLWYAKGAASAGQNLLKHDPKEWELGASGYLKRYGDIMGQYAIRKTVMFGFESLLHEDNRYFPSRRRGFWRRTGYALSSGILAQHDNGKRYPSVSLLVGYASGSYLSRFWQPEGSRTVGDAGVSFGIAMGWNIGLGVVKEFLPDILRPLTKNRRTDAAYTAPIPNPESNR
jgi:hypothetical protein